MRPSYDSRCAPERDGGQEWIASEELERLWAALAASLDGPGDDVCYPGEKRGRKPHAFEKATREGLIRLVYSYWRRVIITRGLADERGTIKYMLARVNSADAEHSPKKSFLSKAFKADLEAAAEAIAELPDGVTVRHWVGQENYDYDAFLDRTEKPDKAKVEKVGSKSHRENNQLSYKTSVPDHPFTSGRMWTRAEGFLHVDDPGMYTLEIKVDDAGKVYLNSALVFNTWEGDAATPEQRAAGRANRLSSLWHEHLFVDVWLDEVNSLVVHATTPGWTTRSL